MAINPISPEVTTLQYTPPPGAVDRNDPAVRAREAQDKKKEMQAPPAKEDFMGAKIDLMV
ncbi:MAG: hypothetical protein JXA52_06040 [Planctomycetes bacterium]|nr:hypothetical protein [Planctomycetota bacterium]